MCCRSCLMELPASISTRPLLPSSKHTLGLKGWPPCACRRIQPLPGGFLWPATAVY
jgi:hypothetical protein